MTCPILRLLALACCLAFPRWSAAQAYDLVAIDPSLRVFDINNDLVAVGQTTDGVPFIAGGSNVRLFPDLREFIPERINNRGVIAGIRRFPDGSEGVFRIASDGTGYLETRLSTPPGTHYLVARLTDSGLALIKTWVFLRATQFFLDDYVWDGTRVLSVRDDYEVATASARDVGEDGTIGGTLNGPFLKRLGEPLVRPWAGQGAVSNIGAAGHVVGPEGAGFVLRQPDGTTTQITGCVGSSVSDINRAGDFLGSCLNEQNRRSEPFLFRNGQRIAVNDFFHVPDWYVSTATHLTDNGAILVGAVTELPAMIPRQVLLIPAATAPAGVKATVSGSTVTLTWNAVTLAIDYIVEAGSAPGRADFFNGAVGPQLSVSGTVPPGRYFVRVRARTLTGLGPPSSEIEVNVP